MIRDNVFIIIIIIIIIIIVCSGKVKKRDVVLEVKLSSFMNLRSRHICVATELPFGLVHIAIQAFPNCHFGLIRFVVQAFGQKPLGYYTSVNSAYNLHRSVPKQRPRTLPYRLY